MGGGGKSGDTTIGYRYYFDIHMAVCRGPVDELVEIQVGELTAWAGSVQSSTTIEINAPDLFGGDKKEGGIQGSADIMMGESTQGVNPRLQAMVGGIVPGFRRLFTIFYSGMVCAMNPYPKSWKMRCRRALLGWDGDPWYPEKAVIQMANQTIRAMNPAHVIYEAATNREWGRGWPRSLMDEDSFTNAANKLCAECFGFCYKWNRQEDLDAFVQRVLDHIGGAVYFDRDTGLFTLRLIRADYNADTLPVFDYNSGIVAVEADDASSTDVLTNEQLVTYHDPITDEDKQVRAQNPGNLQAVGAIYSTTTEYTGIPTPDLAMRVAMRDLKANGTPLKRYVITLDRRGMDIAPTDVFKISVPDRDIAEMIVRVGKLEYGQFGDGFVKATVLQDIFGLPDTTYQSVEPGQYVPPNRTPAAPALHRNTEATYRDLVMNLSPADLAQVQPGTGTIKTFAAKPTALSLSYQLWDDPGLTGTFTKVNTAGFTPMFKLAAPLGFYDETLSYSNDIDADQIEEGTAAMVDDEIILVTSIDTALKTAGIKRACVDTLPAKHLVGAVVWSSDDFFGADPREFAAGIEVMAQYRTQTSSAVLPASAAPTDTITIVARQEMPYPPGDLKLGGTPFGSLVSGITGDLVFTWAHRDRITQQDKLVSHTEPSVGPEAGVTYNVEIYDDANVLITDVDGITGEGVTIAESVVGHGTGATLRAVVYAVRDSIDSYQRYDFTFQHWLSTDASGWGFDFGYNFGEN